MTDELKPSESTDKVREFYKLFVLFIAAYAVGRSPENVLFKLPFVLLALEVIITKRDFLHNTLFWAAITGLLLVDLYFGYLTVANHHFLLVYLALVALADVRLKPGESFLEKNIKLLLFITLLFSGLQKLFSPTFLSGDYYYYVLNTGGFFKPLLGYMPEAEATISHNRELIQALNESAPKAGEAIVFKPAFAHTYTLSLIISWGTVLLELAAAVALLLKPKGRLTHLLLLALIASIFFMRLETGFLSILCILGIFLTPSSRLVILYKILLILFIGLMLSNLGYF